MLPKFISKKKEKYEVFMYSKKYKKIYYVGLYDTMEEAIAERDKFIIDNYNDVTYGYTPKGIYYVKKENKYQVCLSFKNKKLYIGYAKNIKEALKLRSDFINSYR